MLLNLNYKRKIKNKILKLRIKKKLTNQLKTKNQAIKQMNKL